MTLLSSSCHTHKINLLHSRLFQHLCTAIQCTSCSINIIHQQNRCHSLYSFYINSKGFPKILTPFSLTQSLLWFCIPHTNQTITVHVYPYIFCQNPSKLFCLIISSFFVFSSDTSERAKFFFTFHCFSSFLYLFAPT